MKYRGKYCTKYWIKTKLKNHKLQKMQQINYLLHFLVALQFQLVYIFLNIYS